MLRITAFMLLLATAGCTVDQAKIAKIQESEASELTRELAGRTAGKPADCIPTTSLSGPHIIGNTLLYSEFGRVWRTDLAACPGLRNDSVLIIQQVGARICRRDRFTVLDRGQSIPGSTCLMGRFTPYTRS